MDQKIDLCGVTKQFALVWIFYEFSSFCILHSHTFYLDLLDLDIRFRIYSSLMIIENEEAKRRFFELYLWSLKSLEKRISILSHLKIPG